MNRLQRFHINGLKALESVGRLGSLQAAADELGVTPGAVSQHLIRAERQLGRAVFTRTPKGLLPTALGARLLPRLTAAFRTLDDALAVAEEDRERALTVSVAPVLASKWLVPRLSRFRAAHPDIRIRIDATTEIVDLDSSDIDLALRVGRGDWANVRLRRMLPMEVFPVCAPALAQTLRSPEDLRSAPIVLDSGARGIWDHWLAPYGMKETDLGPADHFTDASLCADAAIGGQGVMLGWHTLAVDAIRAGLLVAPFARAVDIGTGYFAVTSPTRPETRQMKAFLAWVEEEMAATAREFGRPTAAKRA
ncbi:LysR substrate-binding domain-containing protein [Mesorhizobium australicum]|uniref:DNA-binding transcriptional regulator, LysR family n=1 Tax=Mesorhizobium australicum TaxID=536018 RepID=A0A1X7PKK6_9HYPH|nr:LysR substrate-binding domain-containing protein [Mesorhizobium australicum]SMH51240.1 DNA-binding transcriptional regulator, LysR family [Mesorhizobium australicum]